MRQKQATDLAILAGAAALSALIYWFVYSSAYSLLDLYTQPGFDLYRRSQTAPASRWWLAVAFLLRGGLYGLGWQTVRRLQSRAAWAIVLGGGLASGVALLFMYPFGATDIFDYIMHARIFGIYGANPFYDLGREFSYDPLFQYMGWKDYPSTYGPLWILLSAGVARFAGDGVVANVLALKLLSGAFVVAGALVVAATLRRMAPERALAGVLLFAWNPIILYETFGNGHNDMAMIFWVLVAVWCMSDHRYVLAILALVVGTLFKFIPLLLLPAAGLIALRDLPDTRARLRFVLLAGLATLAVGALAYLPFWRDLTVLTVVRRRDLYTTSLPALLAAWLKPRWGDERAVGVLSAGATLLTLLFALWQALRALRDRSWESFPRAGFYILTFYLLCTCLWFQEWYTMWPIALAAFLPAGWAVGLALLFNYAALTKPFVFGPMWLWLRPLPPGVWLDKRLGPAVLALPWLYVLLLLMARSYRRFRGTISSS
jgi:hypothetical protein